MDANSSNHEPKILVVDDEQSLVNLCLLILEQAGYNVRGALSGKQALQMVGDEVPDLILLDVMMPGMTGIEVCRRIRETMTTERPYILMYTADDRQYTKTESLDAGANDLISKDTPIFDLPNKIQSYLSPTA
ncbi:response regulator [Candidatus Leptofilum sp.]|uniref:response regulator n=1 Tax=Candidatus Leptofilum sp. TaxID=3241576 RepID=UPI003B5A14A3